ncbi:M3 family oligoendopeptidase [Alkaliphilus hydrothermalis]|uniref:PepF/M3 family oligoendopeptidase n=1 Tax=Alkaliphilus hydrothermalis TaxID=1482730 RepID=A0ABS2NNS4_9FIRM|nr:M3 family oligoendopeptidase [Alkaliphilus hydrothermalis]MBM7614229.1 pepF/M3 family oligoendopeptidase [Alkaliphilus hydrothermalis]
MELKWSLKELYPSFEDDSFKEDLAKVTAMLEEMNNWIDKELGDTSNPVVKMETFLKKFSVYKSTFHKLFAFTLLTMSTEATHPIAPKYLNQLEQKQSELTKIIVAFQKWVGRLDNLDELIQASDLTKEHEFFIKEMNEKNQYLLSEAEEVIISKMSNTGSKSWKKLQELLISTLMVPITINGEEKELPLPAIRNMAYVSDANTRKIAYEAELKAYKMVDEASAAALNGIKGEVITSTSLRGYKSPLEETLLGSRMEEEILNSMLEAMKESLPSFHKYYLKKAELLGHKKGLPFYDLMAPMGSFDKKYSYKEATDYVIKHFGSFSQKLADYAKKAVENNWIDVEPRKGKRGGAFCFNLHPIKESRFLLNFDGTFKNVSTLAHELGHGYHGSCLVEESPLNTTYPMPLAETASIFAETIITNAALKEATKEEAFSILESSISHSGQIIVDIYSRFLFESALFEERKSYALSVDRLNELMIQAQKEAYGKGLDEDYLHPYMWVNKSHYYSADRNFYNFPYAFGLLFALGIYGEYLKRGESFIEEYDQLLAATGKNSVRDVAKMAGIDVASKDFWKSSLSLIEKDIEKFIKLADEVATKSSYK